MCFTHSTQVQHIVVCSHSHTLFMLYSIFLFYKALFSSYTIIVWFFLALRKYCCFFVFFFGLYFVIFPFFKCIINLFLACLKGEPFDILVNNDIKILPLDARKALILHIYIHIYCKMAKMGCRIVHSKIG